jgi:hypothetical protein
MGQPPVTHSPPIALRGPTPSHFVFSFISRPLRSDPRACHDADRALSEYVSRLATKTTTHPAPCVPRRQRLGGTRPRRPRPYPSHGARHIIFVRHRLRGDRRARAGGGSDIQRGGGQPVPVPHLRGWARLSSAAHVWCGGQRTPAVQPPLVHVRVAQATGCRGGGECCSVGVEGVGVACSRCRCLPTVPSPMPTVTSSKAVISTVVMISRHHR